MIACIVPPYLQRRLAETDSRAARAMDVDLRMRRSRSAARPVPVSALAPDERAAWTVHTADGAEILPGEPVRRQGQPASGDRAVDEAASGITAALGLFSDVYARDSFDGRGAEVVLTVHYGQDYANAFWDGSQLVFGDGDGRIFGRFTASPDVVAHEFVHAVTQYTSSFVYRGQSGSLNESVSDVFASCVKQRVAGQQAVDADWLIGTELFLPGVQARGLRDLAAPGTAYDDPVLGSDPQPSHLDDFVETEEDDGGVHLNSGIPNRAFHLAALRIGGTSWAGAGRIWWEALNSDGLRADSNFADFARATVTAAGQHAAVVRRAWQEVGVRPRGGRVRVRRTGGFVGRPVQGEVDLEAMDGRAVELATLTDRMTTAPTRPTLPTPPVSGADRFTYEFDLDGVRRVVPEQQMTDDLRRVADLVLRAPEA